jgi:radical SAM superfamily enzyme YgiQ (UPF0313 family)
MSNILLTHGYFIAEDPHEQQIMKPYPTLGLLYISSYLKSKGFAVDLYDSTFQDLTHFAEHVQTTRPSLVGIYVNLMTKQNVLRMVTLCKAVGATVILGGPEPSSYAEAYLAQGVDIVVKGEGELTIEELIPHLAKQGMTGLGGVKGIYYLDDDGQMVTTLPREQISDLSAMPFPDRDAIDMARYLDTWKTHHGQSSVSMITARGCPYTCKWCSHTVFGHTHRRRTVEEVADEVEMIRDKYNPDLLWYADDVLTINPRWFLKYHEELKRRNIRIPFECISRADRLNEKTIVALAEMGCYRLWIGAESGSQRILDRMERKANIEDVQLKTKMLQNAGISVGMFIMLGYDGEEISDIEATADHLKKSNPDIYLTTVAYPIKGTAYYEKVAHNVVSDLDWQTRTDRDLRVAGRYSARFYDHATRWLVNEVNLHKAQVAGSHNYWQMGKMLLNAKRGRLGMNLTKHEREEGGDHASGRGWSAENRATDGW